MMLSVCLFGPDAWKDTTSVPFITGWEPRFAVLVPMAATTLMLSFQTFFRVIFNAVNPAFFAGFPPFYSYHS